MRLWDPRIGSGGSGAVGNSGGIGSGSGKGIGVLVGHTDVVRRVVAGWGGDYVSSHQSILNLLFFTFIHMFFPSPISPPHPHSHSH